MIELEVVSIDKKNGTAECRYIYNDALIELYKKETGAKVIRKHNVGRFILKYLTEATDFNSTTPVLG